jgi:hypothetical protein
MIFHAQFVPLETMKILSESLPHATDDNGIIRDDNGKWFILFISISN